MDTCVRGYNKENPLQDRLVCNLQIIKTITYKMIREFSLDLYTMLPWPKNLQQTQGSISESNSLSVRKRVKGHLVYNSLSLSATCRSEILQERGGILSAMFETFCICECGTARPLSFALLLTIGKKSTGDLRLQQPPYTCRFGFWAVARSGGPTSWPLSLPESHSRQVASVERPRSSPHHGQGRATGGRTIGHGSPYP